MERGVNYPGKSKWHEIHIGLFAFTFSPGFTYQQEETSCVDVAGWQEEGAKLTNLLQASSVSKLTLSVRG